jgi:putative flippase GtrA
MSDWNRRRLWETFLRFVVVGVIATGVHYLVLVLVVELVHWSAVRGSGLGFCTGAVVNYLLNRRFTFRSEVPHVTAVSRFVVVMGGAFTLNQLLMWTFTHWLGWPYLVGQVLTTGVTLFWNFVGNALWSFAHPTASASQKS